jgi:hypothetical protein
VADDFQNGVLKCFRSETWNFFLWLQVETIFDFLSSKNCLLYFFPSKYRTFLSKTNYIFFILYYIKSRLLILTKLHWNLVCFHFQIYSESLVSFYYFLLSQLLVVTVTLALHTMSSFLEWAFLDSCLRSITGFSQLCVVIMDFTLFLLKILWSLEMFVN